MIVLRGNERDTSLVVMGRNKRYTRSRSGSNVHDAGIKLMYWVGLILRNECTNNERYEWTMNRITGRMVLVVSFYDYAAWNCVHEVGLFPGFSFAFKNLFQAIEKRIRVMERFQKDSVNAILGQIVQTANSKNLPFCKDALLDRFPGSRLCHGAE